MPSTECRSFICTISWTIEKVAHMIMNLYIQGNLGSEYEYRFPDKTELSPVLSKKNGWQLVISDCKINQFSIRRMLAFSPYLDPINVSAVAPAIPQRLVKIHIHSYCEYLDLSCHGESKLCVDILPFWMVSQILNRSDRFFCEYIRGSYRPRLVDTLYRNLEHRRPYIC